MANVICNSSPIQYLHLLGRLDILESVFGCITIPEAVEREIEAGRVRGVFLPDLRNVPWVNVHPARLGNITFPNTLGEGEREVISFGLMTDDALLILDDRAARRFATNCNLRVLGTLGILLLAKDQGLLPSVRSCLDRLQELNFRVAPSTRQAVLGLAGE